MTATDVIQTLPRSRTAAGIRRVACPDGFVPRPEETWQGAKLWVESLTRIDAARLEQLAAPSYDAQQRD